MRVRLAIVRRDHVVPRIAVQLPLPLPVPDGFDLSRPETWPRVTGRLEFVAGRLPAASHADLVDALFHRRSCRR